MPNNDDDDEFHAKHLTCAVHQYLANKIVFSVRRKTPLLSAGSRSSTGSEFQTVGSPTEKARRPSVLRRYRATIKRCRLTDRRCRLATSATGVQQMTVDTSAPSAVEMLCVKLLYINLFCLTTHVVSKRSWSYTE